MKTLLKILKAIGRAYFRSAATTQVSPWPMIMPFPPGPWRGERS